MTARLITTFGALALGLGAFAAAPVMAQGTAAAPAQAPAAATSAAAQGMVRPMHHGHMASTHHMEHHAAMHSKKGHAARAASVTEGDAAVARLNEQSLMAAQKGTNFTPSGTRQ